MMGGLHREYATLPAGRGCAMAPGQAGRNPRATRQRIVREPVLGGLHHTYRRTARRQRTSAVLQEIRTVASRMPGQRTLQTASNLVTALAAVVVLGGLHHEYRWVA